MNTPNLIDSTYGLIQAIQIAERLEMVDNSSEKCHIQQKRNAQRDVPELEAYHSQMRSHH